MANQTKHPERTKKPTSTSPAGTWGIWALLLVLTITTIFTGRMDLGAANLPLAMLIATFKATLVVLFFMHLAEQKASTAWCSASRSSS